MVDAVIVAGGYSTRFGVQEKPLVEIDGVPMLARVAKAVASVADDVVINCRADQRDPFERALLTAAPSLAPRFAIDQVSDRGPVNGLERGLTTVGARAAVVVACDLPLLNSSAVEFLADEHATNGHEATVPRIDGYRRPLCAVYSVDPTLDAARSALANETRRMHDVIETLTTAVVGNRRLASRIDPRRLAAVDDTADLQIATHLARTVSPESDSIDCRP